MPDWLKDMAPMLASWGVKVVGALLGIWLAFRLGAWIDRRVSSTLQARNFDAALSKFFASMARWLLIFTAFLSIAGIFGIPTTSFAAVLGAAGLAIGLAFQGTLGNFASGVMLLTFRPFDIGHAVKIAGESGVVREIGLFTTTIDTFDNRRVIIPNGKVASDTIVNITVNEYRRVDINVGTDYGADLVAVRAALEKAAAGIEGRDEERGHQVIVLEFGDSSINWQVRVWCKTPEYWNVWERAIFAIKAALDEAEIGIPFPQRDLHIIDMPEPKGPARPGGLRLGT